MTGATGTGLLEVSGLSRRFGGLVAVSGLAFSVARNEIFGIIGPNGAGKSTAVNLISGVMKPHGGTVRFDGNDVTGMAPHALVRRASCARSSPPPSMASGPSRRTACAAPSCISIRVLPARCLGRAQGAAHAAGDCLARARGAGLAGFAPGRPSAVGGAALRRAEDARHGDGAGRLAAPVDAGRAGGGPLRRGGRPCPRHHPPGA